MSIETQGAVMDQKELFDKIVATLAPHAKGKEALASIGLMTSIQKDLRVNSARFIDIVLDLQSDFGIRIDDQEADMVRTVGDLVTLVASKR
jgi:acyl carrier protein